MGRAFIFPGQGVQMSNMANDFYEKYPSSKYIFDSIKNDDRIQVSNTNGTISEKNYLSLANTQLGIVAVEIAILEAIKSEGITCNATAGLSLGAFSALACSGVLEYSDLFWLIYQRGKLMHEMGTPRSGMDAVIGLSENDIKDICKNISKEKSEYLTIANYNTPSQFVISGLFSSLEKAENLIRDKRGITFPLLVKSAFHNDLIDKANKVFIKTLKKISLQSINVPYVSNVTGEFATDETLPSMLHCHMTSPVYWQKSIETMINSGITEFIEIGPQHTLTSMIKKINPKVAAVSISTVDDLEKYLKKG